MRYVRLEGRWTAPGGRSRIELAALHTSWTSKWVADEPTNKTASRPNASRCFSLLPSPFAGPLGSLSLPAPWKTPSVRLIYDNAACPPTGFDPRIAPRTASRTHPGTPGTCSPCARNPGACPKKSPNLRLTLPSRGGMAWVEKGPRRGQRGSPSGGMGPAHFAPSGLLRPLRLPRLSARPCERLRMRTKPVTGPPSTSCSTDRFASASSPVHLPSAFRPARV